MQKLHARGVRGLAETVADSIAYSNGRWQRAQNDRAALGIEGAQAGIEAGRQLIGRFPTAPGKHRRSPQWGVQLAIGHLFGKHQPEAFFSMRDRSLSQTGR